MQYLKNIFKSVLGLSLILSLSLTSFDSQRLSNKPEQIMGSLVNAFHINTVNAGTILGDNQENLIRFLYWLINGPPATGYPAGYSGPPNGLLGMIRAITGPTALGKGLKSNNITVCTDIPSTGSVSMVEGTGTYKMHFKTPSKAIPTGYTGAGGTFAKHVTVQYNDVTFMNIEFQCSTNVGWLRFLDNADFATPTTARHIEVYWDTETSTDTVVDLYMYYEQGESSSGGNEYFTARMQTEASSKFKIWVGRAVNATGTDNDQGFRAALYGSTADDVINAYMLYSSGLSGGLGITDATTDFTDDGNVNVVGDLQCIDFNDGGIATESVAGCTSLTLTTPSVPIIDSAGNFSINWIAATMKSKMSTVAEP
ncbi:hypothetical protein JYT31_00130 [Beggiatoa alba]|nr:hypothetical protein [Beggiatoa alba]